MTAVSLILLVSALVFYILTRETYVVILYNNGIRIEFHLVIFSLILTEGEDEKGGVRPKIKFYTFLIKRLARLSERSCIRVNSIRLSKLKSLFSPDEITSSYIYHALISSLIAYLYQKSKKLTLENNALVLIPDSQDISYVDIHLSTELYNIVYALTKILFDYRKYKKRGKLKNVGN